MTPYDGLRGDDNNGRLFTREPDYCIPGAKSAQLNNVCNYTAAKRSLPRAVLPAMARALGYLYSQFPLTVFRLPTRSDDFPHLLLLLQLL